MSTATEHRQHAAPHRTPRMVRALVLVAVVTASAALSTWLVGRGFAGVSGNKQAPWIVGRASGVTSYVLLLALVSMGLVLAHPWRSRFSRPSTATRIRLHVSLSVFALAFLVLHVVALATDSYAGVGLRGALLPMGASYRPAAVTLGVVGMWAGLLAGLTAAFAGRFFARVWWPIHKVSAVVLVLVWLHAVLAGTDTRALLAFYVLSGAAVLALAISRYATSTPADRVAEITRSGRAATADRRSLR